MDILHYIPHALGAIGTGALGYFGKRYFDKFLDRFDGAIEDVKEIKGNHLVHLQGATEKSVQILERIEVGQAEMAGYLRGIAEKK